MHANKKQRKEEAFREKAAGSEALRNGHLHVALECYDRAIRLDHEEGVYFANRSACLFELGRYAESLEDSKQAADLFRGKARTGFISRADLDMLLLDLFRRSSRAMLCINTQESLGNAAALLSRAVQIRDEPDVELTAMLETARRGAAAPVPMAQDTAPPTGRLPRYRPSQITGLREYFAVGHEPAWSALVHTTVTPADLDAPLTALDDEGEDEEGAVHLEMREVTDPPITMLFGGTNDGRQLLATLRDIQLQVERSNGRVAYGQASLDVWLNDIRPHCFARLLLVLRALTELSSKVAEAARQANPAWGEASGARAVDLLELSDEAARAAFLVYHLYLGAFLLPHEGEWLRGAIDAIDKELEGGSLPLAWARMDPAARAPVRAVLKEWRDMLAAQDGSERMGRSYTWAAKRPEEAPINTDEIDENLTREESGAYHSLSEERRAMREEVRQIMLERLDDLSDEAIAEMAAAEGLDASASGPHEALKGYWTSGVDPRVLDGMASMPNAHREMDFFYSTMLLPVPTRVVPEGQERQLMKATRGLELHRDWRPNVTILAKDWLDFKGGQVDLVFCPFHSLRLLLSGSEDEELLQTCTAFEAAATFFVEAALGLSGLVQAGALHVRMVLGDVHDLQGLTHGAFDRVYVSNIPDYTTLLPTTVFLAPLLKPDRRARLKHNVLRHTAHYKDLSEYVHSSTYVPDLSSMPHYLGVEHEHGGLWAHFVEWSRGAPTQAPADGPEEKYILPAADVKAWLATVFYSIAMPVVRDPAQPSNEARPLTLQFFFELCDYMLRRQGVAPHVLATLIEGLMRSDLETVALPPDESPWPEANSFRLRQWRLPRVVPTGAFTLELRMLSGLWAPSFGFTVCPPPGSTLPTAEDLQTLTLRVSVPPDAHALFGQPMAAVLGAALLSPAFIAAHKSALVPRPCHPTNPMLAIIDAFMGSHASQQLAPEAAGGDGLRTVLLSPASQRSGDVHLLSCVGWESQTSTLRLVLPKEDLESLRARGFRAVLIRTDSWTAVSEPTSLGEASAGVEVEAVTAQLKALGTGEAQELPPPPKGIQAAGGAAAKLGPPPPAPQWAKSV